MLPVLQHYKDGMRAVAPNVWGFKTALPEIRKGLFETRASGLDITFEQFLTIWTKAAAQEGNSDRATEKAKQVAEGLTNAANLSGISVMDLVHGKFGSPSDDEKTMFNLFLNDVGIEHLENVRCESLIASETGLRGIFNEIVRRAIIKGVKGAPIYPALASEQQRALTAPTVILPFVDVTESIPEQSAEAAGFPLAKAAFGTRSIELKKYGLAVRITDEAVRWSSVNIVSLLMQNQGRKLGMLFDAVALYVMLNGDQVDNSMTPVQVGVADTGEGFTFDDWIHVSLEFNALGQNADLIIAGMEESEKLHKIPQFQEPVYRVGDRTFIQVNFQNAKISRNVTILTKSNMPDNTIQVADSRTLLLQTNGKPLLIENDRDILDQTRLSVMSQEICFGNIERTARVTLKTDTPRTSPNTFGDYGDFWIHHDDIPIQA